MPFAEILANTVDHHPHGDGQISLLRWNPQASILPEAQVVAPIRFRGKPKSWPKAYSLCCPWAETVMLPSMSESQARNQAGQYK